MNGERDSVKGVISRDPSTRWLRVLAVVLLAGVLVTVALIVRRHKYVGQLARSNGEMREELTRTHQELNALTAKLNMMIAAARTLSSETAEPVVAQPKANETKAAAKRLAPEETRWKQIKDELALHKKQLAENKENLEKTRTDLEGSLNSARTDLEGNLSSARDELGQSIARNHDELIALAKKGERDYFEFDISKARDSKNAGPIRVSLRKARTKQQYCDLMLLVDDVSLTKKHVNLYEPAFL